MQVLPDERECIKCAETKPWRTFINYNESASRYSKICRPCRELEPMHFEKRECPSCEKSRNIDAFVENPRPDVFNDKICRTCRRNIERQWSKGRWQLEGYTSLPARGSHSQVQCISCTVILDRRRVLTHKCGA